MRSLKGNPQQALLAQGMSSAQIRDGNSYLSHESVCQLLEESAEVTNEAAFGFKLAKKQSLNELDALELAIFLQPTVRDAIQYVKANHYIHANGTIFITSEQNGRQQLSLAHLFNKEGKYKQICQLAVQRTHDLIVAKLLGDTNKAMIHLTQSAPNETYAAMKHIKFNAEFNGVSFPLSWLNAEFKFERQHVLKFIDSQLDGLKQAYPDNLVSMISHLINELLPSGECSVERIANILDMHPRVLQLKLKELNTSYNAILKESRLQLALNYLKEQNTSMTDMALHLGYSDVSTFSRNFKEWTGLSPTQWKKAEKSQDDIISNS
ncbi:helix-turn-helix domain-containing protein [Aeromonas mytilicola subsp. aquatica]|uniref:AraC family transcriptional regulator n=1 Tax=Aeromonas mytilicola TaxID=3377113 RepID=UPI0037BE3B8A